MLSTVASFLSGVQGVSTTEDVSGGKRRPDGDFCSNLVVDDRRHAPLLRGVPRGAGGVAGGDKVGGVEGGSSHAGDDAESLCPIRDPWDASRICN